MDNRKNLGQTEPYMVLYKRGLLHIQFFRSLKNKRQIKYCKKEEVFAVKN